MLIKRSIPIILEKSHAVLDTVEEFNRYQKSISESCFNEGSPRNALALHKEVYNTEASSLNSQMRCSSIRLVAGAYQSAKSNKNLLNVLLFSVASEPCFSSVKEVVTHRFLNAVNCLSRQSKEERK